jgi:hypothetical protein
MDLRELIDFGKEDKKNERLFLLSFLYNLLGF